MVVAIYWPIARGDRHGQHRWTKERQAPAHLVLPAPASRARSLAQLGSPERVQRRRQAGDGAEQSIQVERLAQEIVHVQLDRCGGGQRDDDHTRSGAELSRRYAARKPPPFSAGIISPRITAGGNACWLSTTRRQSAFYRRGAGRRRLEVLTAANGAEAPAVVRTSGLAVAWIGGFYAAWWVRPQP
jgi:hypothetical protein